MYGPPSRRLPGLLDEPPRCRPIATDRDDAAVHLLHEELQRIPKFEELSRDTRRSCGDRVERSTDVPHTVVIPKRFECGDITSVDGISKRLSKSADSHFVGYLIRLRPDT